MDCLIDAHALIWFFNGDKKLSDKAREAIENPDNLKFISVATIWEIAIKISLEKLIVQNGFNQFPELIEANGFEVLPITFEHAMTVSTLEFLQR